MNMTAVLLVVVSAFIHASWNFISKNRRVNASSFFLATIFVSIILAPMIWLYQDMIPHLPIVFWLFLLGAGISETVYYVALVNAYKSGDLSVAYPLLRAIPVILVAVISLLIRDGHQPQGWGLAGIFVVAAGCLLLPLNSFRNFKISSYLTFTCLFALLAGLGTTGYSLIDDRALRLLNGLAGNGGSPTGIALFYLEFHLISTAAIMLVYILAVPTERQRLRAAIPRQLLSSAGTGILVMGAYGLVLVAMSLSSSVSYIVAFRQLSIPIGALLGMTVQKEPRHFPRLAGISLVFAGLILVAVA
jgi:drug/metabolite transporter (DMT)-like permease